jgi:hypothetical protein
VTDPDSHGIGEDEFLTLQIGGGKGRPDRLLLIGRPREGVVRVREWTTQTMNSEGEDADMDAGELLEQLEEAAAAHQPMNEDIYRLRRWLQG